MQKLGRMTRSELETLHERLLEHHKLLLDATRAEYERDNGPLENAAAFLQLLIHGEAFAWLQPFTGLLVELDDPKLTPDGATARTKVLRLLSEDTPPFYPRYVELLAKLPEAARSHERTLEVLASLEQ